MQNNSTDSIYQLPFASQFVTQELEGLYGQRVLRDMAGIMRLYDIYENGVDFTPNSSKEYVAADLKFKRSSAIIDKIVRFMFSKPPEHRIESASSSGAVSDKEKADLSVYQEFLDTVLEKNKFNAKLLKGAKDCLIGKRVAILVNFSPDTGITISFVPSLEFVYDVNPVDPDKLSKIVLFYGVNDMKEKADQRIYKKKYWIAEDGFCHLSEGVYDGGGNLVESIYEDERLRFTYIPAVVVLNDGLTGDMAGTSEIDQIAQYESWYSKLNGADIDSERMNMNPVRYAIDCDPASTANLPINAGAFWDLHTDQNTSNPTTASVGTLNSDTSYTSALAVTLDRIQQAMYDQAAVPNVSPQALQGVVTSGKTLKAIYWDLVVKCDDKMITWKPALEFVDNTIIEGAKLYPECANAYLTARLPDLPFKPVVTNQYSLPEDEAEEKQLDLAEVESHVMSRRTYMMKWQGLTEDEANAELQQIAEEQHILDSVQGVMPQFVNDEGSENDNQSGLQVSDGMPTGNGEMSQNA